MKWKIIGFFLSTSNFAIKRIFRSVELRSFNFFFPPLLANSQLRKTRSQTCEYFDRNFNPISSPPRSLSLSLLGRSHLVSPRSTILDNRSREYEQGERDTAGIVGRRANATMSRDALDYPIRNGGCSPRPNRDSSEARAHTHKRSYPEETGLGTRRTVTMSEGGITTSGKIIDQ